MAWLLIATSLISSTGESSDSAQILDKLRASHPELFVVPEIPPWPNNLPPLVATPRDAECRAHGVDLGEGSWVPHATGRVMQRRLLMLEAYPQRAQAVIDALVPRIVEAVADQAAEPAGYDLQTVVTWALVGFSVGAAAVSAVMIAAP